MEFKPIKTRRIYEEIVDQLKFLIIKGNLKPGDKLPSERELSERLGVSRSSVREALSALEAMSILDIRSGEGTFVRQTSQSATIEPLAWVLTVENNPVIQLMEVRRVLEVEAAGLAARRATGYQLEKIVEALNAMKEAAEKQELAVEYDLKFHFTIAEATHNTILLRIMNTVADIMHQTFRANRQQLYGSPGMAERIIREHSLILEAIQERNPAEASKRMLEHLNNVEAGLIKSDKKI
jgi:GntR family transcriptional repressor for pyruvate dehydrogenase complex